MVAFSNAHWTTYQYDAADRRTEILRQNGNRTSLVYDDASQVMNLLHRNSGGTVLTAFTYTYDNAGTRTQPNAVKSPPRDWVKRLTAYRAVKSTAQQ